MSAVSCNGCTLCCDRDLVRLLPGDDPAQYQTMAHPYLRGALALAHKPSGGCVYLAERRCTIHDSKPQMCREMDCRNVHMHMTRKQARAAGVEAVWKRGRDNR